MEYRIVIFAFAALFCQVQSQRCFAPEVEVITYPPIPQVPTTPIVTTATVVDNSVTIALANALQLLIVKDIIESKLGASCLPNLLPIETPYYEYLTSIVPCTTPIEVIAPVIEPYPYLGGCTEISYPNFGCAPSYYPCGTEIVNQYPISGTPVITIPSYNNGCYQCCNELVTSIPCNSYGEINPCNTCGTPESICVCGQYIPEVITPNSPCNCYGTPYNTFGVTTEFISPCYPGCGVPETTPPCIQYYNGFPEVISPIYKPGCAGIPELLPANPYVPCRDIVTPCNPGCSGFDFSGAPVFAPNFCGNPVAAEVYIPSCIPAQLNCNFGYSPSLGPCINFNVEPVPLGSGFC